MKYLTILLSVMSIIVSLTLHAQKLPISMDEEKEIGLLIWTNECNKSFNSILSWNKGEDFLSCGIGHFIWYPESHIKHFNETFIHLLQFLQLQGYTLPGWLATFPACPWNSREDFLASQDSEYFMTLKKTMCETVSLQARFMIQRLEDELTKAEMSLFEPHKQIFNERICEIWQSPKGKYALIDYLNFKGTGLSSQERYEGKGWGLVQVVLAMQKNSPYLPTTEFALSAKKILKERVENAPKERGEARWLAGWNKRIYTYIPEQDKACIMQE